MLESTKKEYTLTEDEVYKACVAFLKLKGQALSDNSEDISVSAAISKMKLVGVTVTVEFSEEKDI